MDSVRTPAKNKSIAQLVRRECVPTLLMSIPRRFVPIFSTAFFMCALVCTDVMRTSASRCVFQNVFTVYFAEDFGYERTRFTVKAHAWTGQSSWFDRYCVIFVIFSPFF